MIFLNKPEFIVKSQLFCKEIGMAPDEIPFPQKILSPAELWQKSKDYDEILSVVSFFGEKILHYLKGTPILLAVSNEEGFILHMMGDETIKKTLNDLGIRLGIQFTEASMGTNVVNLSLTYNESPIQLIGDDHYHEYLHGSACYAVAFRYTDVNGLLGSLIIMTAKEFQNPMMITLLATTVDSIERELMLRKQNRKLNIQNQIIMDNARNGIIMTNREGEITTFNQYAELFTGRSRADMLGTNVRDLGSMGEYIYEVVRNGKTFEDIQMTFEQSEAEERMVCLFDAYPLYDEKKQLLGAFGQFRSITDRVKAEERYNYLANHDDLTKLPNRRYYKEKVPQLIEHAQRTGQQVAVVCLDLDRFKIINDTLGHSSGDLLLIMVATRFGNVLLPGEIVARMGGDEFMFVLPNMGSKEEALQRVKDILHIFQEPFSLNGYEFHLTASAGISIYPKDGHNLENLMIAADTAMYSAKNRGLNLYALYSPDMNVTTREKIVLESSLRRAIENEEFRLFYQPQVDIRTGELKGVEALVRWQHPTKGFISPSEFIPIAEESGLITQIDRWVLRTACLQNKKWQDQGIPPFRVSVNLSSQEFLDDALVDVVKKVLDETGLEPRYLDLEITETMTMNVNHAIPMLRKLHSLGIQISMDDFGTGYSSLNYLKNFSIDRLKIDQSFVRDLSKGSNGTNIVSIIIAIAHSMNLEVVAEGVEEKEQLRFLQIQKCNEVQGYYFSPPIPAEEFEGSFSALLSKIKKLY
ncbi:PAS domain S-box-containing protein/diguanylate cyclase (GGDEF) domain-containing protein [Paenibacillus sp. UNCCL117]|uniref:EAL domain-containing protein n=1 Tax=unclassified Paenibacillus TaxID=185978 RepID=UPI00088E2D98|nr:MULTISPECIES: EAL domain-containing protein [unclassified Paenibacillus]SDD82697.1 PAS domain S-box-containing protein/diguanylate cyclase (GGDEF) domain-containing protein [Paenibacillus sp. cl123]SFW55073.1 PAS domain S-box-containing protein/diguanylate cyclase (GGDEF) domain-containing protein [Paenibacillus sp. UNCCL117]